MKVSRNYRCFFPIFQFLRNIPHPETITRLREKVRNQEWVLSSAQGSRFYFYQHKNYLIIKILLKYTFPVYYNCFFWFVPET